MGRGNVQDENARDLLLPGGSGRDDDFVKNQGKQLFTLGVDRNYANVLTTALGFLLVFTAFQTTQMLAASIIGDLGTISLGIIYTLFTLGGFVAPVIARMLGPKMGMFFASLSYVIYVASLIDVVVPVVLLCACLIGFGAAVLWVSQGMMMSLCTNNQNKTKYNSLFWGLFNLCVIPGNIAGHFILMHGDENSDAGGTTTTEAPDPGPFKPMIKGWQNPNSALFVVLTICGGIGSCVFLLLREPDKSRGTAPTLETRPVLQQIKATFALVFYPRMVCLLPLFTFTGVAMTMWASWFTRQMYKTEIGLVMIGLGLAEFCGGFTIGPFVEKYGRNPGLVLGATCGIIAMLLTYMGSQDMASFCTEHTGSAKPCKEFTAYTPFYIAAALYGFMDCMFQSCTAAICASSFASTGHTADAWALFRTFQSLGAAVGFLISPSLVAHGSNYSTSTQLLVEIAITVIMGYLAMFGHWLFSKYPTADNGDATSTGLVPGNDDCDDIPHSKAVIVNGMLYSSAIGAGADLIGGGKDADATTAEQATAACESIKALLERCGSSCGKVVKATVFTTVDADAEVVMSIYKKYFVRGMDVVPALTTAMVSHVPGGSRVQIEVVAKA